MAKLRIPVLIDHLDSLLDKLSALWIQTKNYDNLALIESMSSQIERIIETLEQLE
jgi:hypothetical protein